MDRYSKRYHIRFANLRKLIFDDRILNLAQVLRLQNNPDIQVLYIATVEEKLKGEMKL